VKFLIASYVDVTSRHS